MKYTLSERDVTGDIPLAHLTDNLDYNDLRESQACPISVQYNEIDLGDTDYGFDQQFHGKEANLYFERMNAFSEMSINDIIDNGVHSWHFHRTAVKGKIKKLFDRIDKNIAKANPLIFHFALDPNSKTVANREKGDRNPRIYFMVGYNGMIHPLFFDPFHELNPVEGI